MWGVVEGMLEARGRGRARIWVSMDLASHKGARRAAGGIESKLGATHETVSFP